MFKNGGEKNGSEISEKSSGKVLERKIPARQRPTGEKYWRVKDLSGKNHREIDR